MIIPNPFRGPLLSGIFSRACCALALVAMPSFLSNCSDSNDDKEEDNGGGGKNHQGTQNLVKHAHDLYVALSFDTLSADGSHGRRSAGYYHSGKLTKLEVPDEGSFDVFANDIFVDGNDVYVCGQDGSAACYWKNGDINYLTDGSVASSIKVMKNKVYVCGHYASYEGDKACCWIDGNRTELNEGMRASDMEVDTAGHVYIVGYFVDRALEREYMHYWTDCETSYISKWQILSQNACMGACVSLDYSHLKNGHPFICLGGRESVRGKGHVCSQWVERKQTSLAAANGNDITAMSCTPEGVLYSCGTDNGRAVLWSTQLDAKGQGSALTTTVLDGSNCALDVVALEGNVYVLADNPADVKNTKARVFKDGKLLFGLEVFNDVYVEPSRICVVPREELAE